ncbi:hypothetical protein [Alteraurantiacibacter buctensis]|uniref:Uncharacterized protein n=1 Tax=Alteraurantiacibacter buctensis TaxID=1503981 RepID=A0A844Z523_9SPHN|nr:hypothetical protein [Alteraurantiacibacter buctensis]MXO72933.1 hypothetical protein [Alteraurantiacibacter buctensis]
MNFFTVLLLIVIAGLAYDVMRQRSQSAGGQPAGPRDQAASLREAELERELAELRERVKVLERIATDDNDTRALAAEIDRLRDS